MRLRGLRHVRQRLGISISQLADLADLRRENVARLEQGQSDAEPALIRRLAMVLGVTQGEIISGVLPAVQQAIQGPTGQVSSL